MEQSPEVFRLLRNPNIHYCVQNSPPLDPILSQMHPVHTLPPYFPKIHSNIIFSSTPISSELSLTFGFSNQNTVCVISCTRATCTTNIILLVLITLIIFGGIMNVILTRFIVSMVSSNILRKRNSKVLWY